MLAASTACTLVLLHSDHDRGKVKRLSTCSMAMLMLTQSLHSARLSGVTSEDLNGDWRSSGIPALVSPQYTRPLPYNGPWGPTEVAAQGAMPYHVPTPTRTTTLGVASHAPVDAVGLVEAATQGNRHKGRGGLPREEVPSNKRVSKRKVAKKVGQACLRCR